jgi:hypothetical protein
MKTEADLFLEEQSERKLNFITQHDFEQLPKKVQQLRWDLFLLSDGYRIDPTTDKNEKRRARMLAIIQQLEQLKKAAE